MCISLVVFVVGTAIEVSVIFTDILLLAMILPMFISLIASYVGLIGFTANVIQFGMDQLHDSPAEDRTLFIHWYVWLYFLTISIGQLTWNLGFYSVDAEAYYNIVRYCLLCLIPLLVITVLIVTLCLVKYKKRWFNFLIEPGANNPYRLVYRVTI